MPTLGNLTRRSALGLVAGVTLVIGSPARAAQLPPIKVSRDTGCQCCGKWAAHLEAAGFAVTITEPADLPGLKQRLGVPSDLAACHTGEVAGYVIEGHVPAIAIKRLLDSKLKATGLAVVGMPVGSPGMEGGTPVVYEVTLFGSDGRSPFGKYRGAEQA